MYNTVKAIHVALDEKIQQVNSNRKQSFHPEEYDMVINEAVREYVNSRISKKLNIKQEGAEDSKVRYDELRYLKRELSITPFYDSTNNRVFTFLPADYKTIITSESSVYYKRNRAIDLFDAEQIVQVYNIDEVFEPGVVPVLTYDKVDNGRQDNNIINLEPYITRIKSVDGRFVFIDKVIDILRRANIDAYHENFDLVYRRNCIIISEYAQRLTTWKIDGWNSTMVNLGDYKRIRHQNTIKTERVENDLIATEDVRGLLTNTHASKNRHLNPISEIVNDRIYVYLNNDFYISKIHLSYYKEPSLCDYRSETLPDIPINDTIVDIAARIILGAIKDQFGYQVEAQKTNLN